MTVGMCKLLTATGPVSGIRLSPDGSRMRFTVAAFVGGVSSLWEARADGTNPYPLLPNWTLLHRSVAVVGPLTESTLCSRALVMGSPAFGFWLTTIRSCAGWTAHLYN